MRIFWSRRRRFRGCSGSRFRRIGGFVDLFVTIVIVAVGSGRDRLRSITVIIDAVSIAHRRGSILIRWLVQVLILILLLVQMRLLFVGSWWVCGWGRRWRRCGCNISIFMIFECSLVVYLMVFRVNWGFEGSVWGLVQEKKTEDNLLTALPEFTSNIA